MIRTKRVLPALLPALVLLTACGSEDADAADPAELASRARASGIAPELVYAVEAPGYTVAKTVVRSQQSGHFDPEGPSHHQSVRASA
ncbi:hypothetical protein [Streptomyces sp. A012304]|uniref:hypothetical protein n=1 Tax=Streptomyces sp. A012304 TaxID=375446 RepID=UPI002802FB36|nr:hypothetical protein [Streptomyces sp. A012304]GKQ37046.1 hypothetical protein ALMP_35850 [Streptomyces sp. A012304]